MGVKDQMGQGEFFDSFYRRQFSKMWTYAVSLIGKGDLAEEIVQDAFLTALVQIDDLMKKERPDFWLRKVVRNKALHVQREQARYTWRLISLEPEQIIDGSAAKQLAEVESSDRVSQIRRTLVETLDAQEIHLLKRIAMDGVTYKKAAEEAGMTIGACQKKIQRIRKKLKKKILD